MHKFVQALSVCIILLDNVVNIYSRKEKAKMKQDEFRRKLIDGTIFVIAQYGLDKASTKQIGTVTSVNEAYIYRCFKNKEHMFAKAFSNLDEELVSKVMEHVSVMYDTSMEFEKRCRVFFFEVWEFILNNRDRCLAYMQYFYSPYFAMYSAEEHEKRCKPIVEKFCDAFKDEADVWMILNHILNVMLDFAVKVHNNLMPNTEIYAEHVFRVVYRSVEQYFRWV